MIRMANVRMYGDENGTRVVSSTCDGVVLLEAGNLQFEGEEMKMFEDAERRRGAWVRRGRRIPRCTE